MPTASAPKVTVMIPTFNQVGTIDQAVAGALRQTYANLEVVVADDASTDGTYAAALRWQSDPRLRVVRRERNLGRAQNYRRTLREDAAGEWVINLDGDDYFTRDGFIAEAVAAARACAEAVLVVGGCRLLEADGRRRVFLPTREPRSCVSGVDYFLGWHGALGVPHMAALYPRDLALALDFYREDIISSDWESLRRLVLRGRVALLGTVAGVWRQSELGQSRTATAEQRLADLRSVDNAHADALALGVETRALEAWRRATVADCVALAVRTYLLRGEHGQALALLRGVRERRPGDYAACLRACARRPGLWAFAALSVVGGGRLTARAWSVWKGLTWRAD